MPSDPCQRGYPAGTQDCAPAGHPEAAPPLL